MHELQSKREQLDALDQQIGLWLAHQYLTLTPSSPSALTAQHGLSWTMLFQSIASYVTDDLLRQALLIPDTQLKLQQILIHGDLIDGRGIPSADEFDHLQQLLSFGGDHLLGLLGHRLSIVVQVAAIKASRQLSVLNAKREQQILKQMQGFAASSLPLQTTLPVLYTRFLFPLAYWIETDFILTSKP